MGQEIERKFLVVGDAWRELGRAVVIRQGYLSTVKERTVRIRTVDSRGFLTIKGVTRGISRLEFEYDIPLEEANQMLDELCERPLIEKTRRKIDIDGLVWEVDEFAGVNQGLILAEVELASPDQKITLPDWIGADVSDDPRYYNANLVANPFSRWV
jgi:adenylate cyclase